MKLLLCAFDPFGGEPVNPAQLAVEQVSLPEFDVTKLIVPTVYGESVRLVTAKMDEISPDVIICVGQAGGRAAITPERVAINIDDSRAADNAGTVHVNQPIDPDGPAAYFSTLPIHAIVDALKAAGIPSQISNSAGTFVCNHLLYGVLRHAKSPAGFIHVPFLPSQAEKRGAASLPLETIVRGLEIAARVCVDCVKSG